MTKWFDRWEHGYGYGQKHSPNGTLLVTRENGVKAGDVRMFWQTDKQMYDTPVLYVADREFKKWWPVKNVVWWRKIRMDKRLATLERFVAKCATVENYEGWQGEYFREAHEISKQGFIDKLKGMKYE